MVGCLARWDQQGFEQTVVRDLEYRALAYVARWADRPAPAIGGLPHLEVAVL